MIKLYKHQSRSYSPFTRHNVGFFCFGRFRGRRILLMNDEFNENQKEYAKDPIPFTYIFLDPENETFNHSINTELKIGILTLYCNLNYFQKLKLRLLFKEHWIQKVDSWKWIVSTLISVLALIISIIALYKNDK